MFSRGEELRRKWLEFCDSKEQPNKSSRICSAILELKYTVWKNKEQTLCKKKDTVPIIRAESSDEDIFRMYPEEKTIEENSLLMDIEEEIHHIVSIIINF